MHQYENFAVAYSIVESRTDKSAKVADFTGVNSIQLYKVGGERKILSLYYHVENKGQPIKLRNAVSGKCMD